MSGRPSQHIGGGVGGFGVGRSSGSAGGSRIMSGPLAPQNRRVQAPPPQLAQENQPVEWMSGGGSGGSNRVSTSRIYLASLNTYQVGWSVTARVFQKGDIREYTNERGAGKIGSVTLVDGSGSMKCVMFGEQCDKWLGVLSEGKVYRISNARISPARDNNWSKSSTDFDMVCTNETTFQELDDDPSCPHHSLRPIPLVELQEILAKQQADQNNPYYQMSGGSGGGVGCPVDVIGIVIECSPQTMITSKKGQQLIKRDVTLTDESGASVKVTIWGDKFGLTDGNVQPPVIQAKQATCTIMAISAARISDFSGCSLSTSFGSGVWLNPTWDESKKLSTWFKQQGAKMIQAGQIQALTTGRSTDGNFFLDQYAFSTIANLHQLKAEFTNKPLMEPIVSKMSVRVTFIKKDEVKPPWYVSCPNETCHYKKVTASDHGQWYCDKCLQVTNDPVYRYLLSIVIQDETGSMWVSCFDREAEKLLGCPANQMELHHSENPIKYHEVFQQAINKDWIIAIKAQPKTDQQPGQFESSGPRFQACSVSPVNMIKDTRELLQWCQERSGNLNEAIVKSVGLNPTKMTGGSGTGTGAPMQL